MSRTAILINMNPRGGMRVPKVGARIVHSMFGAGTVEKTVRGSIGTGVTIKFDKHGRKELQWCFAKFKCKREA